MVAEPCGAPTAGSSAHMAAQFNAAKVAMVNLVRFAGLKIARNGGIEGFIAWCSWFMPRPLGQRKGTAPHAVAGSLRFAKRNATVEPPDCAVRDYPRFSVARALVACAAACRQQFEAGCPTPCVVLLASRGEETVVSRFA